MEKGVQMFVSVSNKCYFTLSFKIPIIVLTVFFYLSLIYSFTYTPNVIKTSAMPQSGYVVRNIYKLADRFYLFLLYFDV